ncbi:hypothetical protein [Dokdonella ginsengisoli]|uniref:Uncharacterized protein n=1 Tax=Dokdonella ginsengisoli TaxID=363846 RepID=A0ABV9QSG0_9GAMM
MSAGGIAIALGTALVLLAGPLAFALAGWRRARRTRGAAAPHVAWNARLTLLSALLYTLAFNLIFFVQELFLVLPKALTPGLSATLFHNDHRWQGEHPLARLFQGTGVLATLIVALACMALLRSSRVRSTAWRLLLVWMAYCGAFMALPQLVVGALSGGSDVGMAMDYLRLNAATKTAIALLALAAMPPLALWLVRELLRLADAAASIDGVGARTRFVFRVATVPLLLSLLPIVAFRVPREWIEVIVVPLVVAAIGLVWMQAGAWRVGAVPARGHGQPLPLAWPAAAVLALLLLFQCVLRPGVTFG